MSCVCSEVYVLAGNSNCVYVVWCMCWQETVHCKILCVCSVVYVFKTMDKVLLLTSNMLQVATLSRNSMVRCTSQMLALRYT